MLDFLRDLRQITSTARGCTRIAYTDLECEAHDLAWQFVADVPGLTRVADAAGNTFIVPHHSLGPEAQPLLLIGSHLDTVIEGGWLDGALGVAAGLHVLKETAKHSETLVNIGVVIFRDEEGVRFSNGLFGSRVFAGLCRTEDLDVVDASGTKLRSVVPDPAGCVTYQTPVKVAGFLECHIEQGLRLQDSRARIGVVPGIVGIRRYALSAIGVANHAGTTEMNRRRDALIPMCRLIADLPSLLDGFQDAVITCGRFTVMPGAPNIVPGEVQAIVESRAQTTEELDTIERRLTQMLFAERAVSRQAGLKLDMSQVADIAPIHTNADMLTALRTTLDERNIPFRDLPSMAGHDTQHAAAVCPAAMFFVPSIDGVSHNPAEDSREEDILLAGDVMHDWAGRCLSVLGID